MMTPEQVRHDGDHVNEMAGDKADSEKGGENTVFELLSEVARAAASTTADLRDTLESMAHAINDKLHKDVCSVCIFKPGGKSFRIEVPGGRPWKPSTFTSLTPEDSDRVAAVVEDLRPLAVEDIRREPRAEALLGRRQGEFLSLLAVPVIGNGRVTGVITVQTREPYLYGRDEVQALIAVSHMISTAAHNSKLYRDFKTQLNALTSIHDIGNAITSILDMDDLLPFICKEVSELFNARRCILRLLEGDMLTIKASSGLPEEVTVDRNIPIGNGISGWVAQTGEPFLFNGGTLDGIHQPDIEATSMLCVPLMVGEKKIGTLALYDKTDEGDVITFNGEDLILLKTFASASSIAIENARMYGLEKEREEKILALYWDVTQTKDYLKSIIDHSADAIIISDTHGIITSWNRQAEVIYGYSEEEALGKFLPMVPEFLIEDEKKHIEKIVRKETISNLETVRRRKDGKLLEVSLTLSPILDSSGTLTGISGISRDITERKIIEKELRRKNKELSRLSFLNAVIRSTLELDKLIRMVLTVITMGDGLGFNRAVLILVNEHDSVLRGMMGVGPANAEEAGRIWNEISTEQKTLQALIDEIERGSFRSDTYLDEVTRTLEIPLGEETVLSQCVKERRAVNIVDARSHPLVPPILVQRLGINAFGLVPLITRGRVTGVVLVDNLFTGKAIQDEDLDFLQGFTGHIASAIENAKLFESVSLAESELKNIFESISDMVFFSDSDCTIRHINQAVVRKVGRPEPEIVGEKCFKIFHGMHDLWDKCPHKKTLSSGEPCVEEVYNPYLKGTFVISTSPIFDSGRNLSGTVHIVRDITELHSLKERVINSERMAALGELAARVAHEIRNPLISVGGFARRLERRLKGEPHEYAKIIVDEVTRLEDILKEILGFVRGGEGLREHVNINDLVKGTVDLVSIEVNERGNSIINGLASTPIMVNVNPDRIKEALLNIIKNANQATDNGIITIKTCLKEREAVTEITDTGTGISADECSSIFNPFFTTKSQGTGLGLAVTHKIIQEHGGRIDVLSRQEDIVEDETIRHRGTTFIIYLPAADDGREG
jgi:PAS domain S-box-containing protein